MSGFALEMRQISKTYDTVRATDSVNLKIKKGSIHALAGENGAGKSTLMKILFGIEKPDAGSGPILINNQQVSFSSPLEAIALGLGMVQQHFAFAGPVTALDNIIVGDEPGPWWKIDRATALEELQKVAGESLKIPWTETAENLPVGQQQRLEILKALYRHAEILILDEPTAVLTPQEVRVFFGLLREMQKLGKTIIIITHKIEEILELCDRVTVLRQGRVVAEFEIPGVTREDLVRAMVGRDVKVVQRKATHNTGEVLLEVRNLATDSVRGGLHGLSFVMNKGEILGVAGVERNGQQDLVESLVGTRFVKGEILFQGEAVVGDPAHRRFELHWGLISEDRHHQSLWLDGTVKENFLIGMKAKPAQFSVKIQTEIKRFEIKVGALSQKVSELSGGNQQKVIVARETSLRTPKLLIASQPTRGVDIGAIELIHHELIRVQETGTGILLFSSDLDELMTLSDHILVLNNGRAAAVFTRAEFDRERIGQAMVGAAV